MGYSFKPGMIYRMPTHFGPLMGPRQGPGNNRFDTVNNPKTTSLSISFISSAEQLGALLPDCFELAEDPVVTIQCSQMTEIAWLAGRGYSMLGVSFPAKFRGKVDNVEGSFLSVLWENMCDPIITGREELGFAKVFSDISSFTLTEDTAAVTASWQGFNFLELKLTQLQKKAFIPAPDTSSRHDGLLHYKYIPKTGHWGNSDVAYPVLSPVSGNNTKIKEYYAGQGTVLWNKARWEDMPTLYNIVNTLAELDVLEFTQGSLVYSIGSDDLRGQKILT